MDTAPRALEGLRVLDQTQVMAGPFCAMLLADMGAESSRSSRRRRRHARDGSRAGARRLRAVPGRQSQQAWARARPQASEGVAILKKLVATADVLVENYRPGVAARLGVDYATLSALNPRLIYCSISGFGQTGPYADRGGYDLIAQGMSGIMSATGSDGGPAGEGRRAHHRSRRRALRRVRHPLRDPRAPHDRSRAARGHLALRGRPGAVGVGGDRVLVHRTDPRGSGPPID
jgi:crotonobetainyl-CoA:carnitine CoA-transferase CaiB-like acyl-CoA transferase